MAAFFGVALVNCTSNVLFLPYMAKFRPKYLTAYFIGMGLSALFPSIISLIQGTGHFECVKVWNATSNATYYQPRYLAPRFSFLAYNVIMLLWMAGSLLSFVLLHWTKFGTDSSDIQEKEANPSNEEDIADHEPTVRIQTDANTNSNPLPLLLLTAWTCCLMNGVIPGIMSFASLPYGQTVFHLTLTLPNLANPLACFLPFFVTVRSTFTFTLLTVTMTIFSAYIVLLAVFSPNPPLLTTGWGAFFCVGDIVGSIFSWGGEGGNLHFNGPPTIVASIVALAMQAYLRTAMAGVLRTGPKVGESQLFQCGVFTQIGSFLGAVAIFPLVNVYNVFAQSAPCSRH